MANNVCGFLPSYDYHKYPTLYSFSPIDVTTFDATPEFMLFPFLELETYMTIWNVGSTRGGSTLGAAASNTTNGTNCWNGAFQVPTPSVFICPSDSSVPPDTTTNSSPLAVETGFATTSYSFNYQVFGEQADIPSGSTYYVPPSRIPSSFQDGTSNTMLIVERYAICGADGDVPCGATVRD